MTSKLLLAGTMLLASASFVGPTADAADGGGSCGGNLIEYVPVNVNGTKVGQLQFYYNAANGNNCAVMLHGGPTWGVAKDTGVLLAKGPSRSSQFNQAAYERNTFSYQAGPIRTDGKGQCVYAGGGITYGGSHHTVYTSIHCG